MEANRLDEWSEFIYEETTVDINVNSAREMVVFMRQQQAEIERLREDKKRLLVLCDERQARAMDYLKAYEVLETTLKSIYVATASPITQEAAGNALAEAQRIKEGDGEQG